MARPITPNTMVDHLKIALAQVNPTVGDIVGNVELVLKNRRSALSLGADLVIFPELVLSGYPPEDLVLKPAFQEQIAKGVENILGEMKREPGPDVLLPTPWVEQGRLYNAVLLLEAGEITAVRHKVELPNYGVFDEMRVFEKGPMPGPVSYKGVRLGVPICEDIWSEDVCECLQETGAELFLVPNGSPYERDKRDMRLNQVVARVQETGLPMAYINQAGGQDELVFDGASFVLGAGLDLDVVMPSFTEALCLTEWTRTAQGWQCAQQNLCEAPSDLASVYQAMVLGLRDYVNKNRFPGIILGLSGGVDSALSAAVAVDALGAERVRCVMMPSAYTSDESLEDAQTCAGLLKTRYETIPIGPAMDAYDAMLAPAFEGQDSDLTEENIQARCRGVLLMALSNKFGDMVLTTGNKSEISMGYATLYGDMCGGYSVLKDVYKTTVFALCHWRNQTRLSLFLGPPGRVIPERIITKPPSAELRADQKDCDSLPEYDELDAILERLIEGEVSVKEVVSHGFDAQTVKRVWRLLDRAEYKRRQAPLGVKITSRAFGRDRRYPITNGFTAFMT